MRTKLLYICFLVMVVCLCLMRWVYVREDQVAEDDEQSTEQTSEDASDADAYLLGYVGDGTGMGCIEFVTLDGDTLLLARTSDYTGEDATLIGSMYTEATSLYAARTTDNGETADVIVNLTELRSRWQHNGQGFTLAADSSAVPFGNSAPQYRHWKLAGAGLVVWREVRHEGGVSEVADTLRIVSLSADTLVLSDMYGEETKYWH